jgi:hypothetical protein
MSRQVLISAAVHKLIASPGMRARQAAGQIPAGLNDGEDILEYNGKDSRVTTVTCKGFCTGKWLSSASCSMIITGN